MVKFTRCDLAFIFYIISSSLYELTEFYVSKCDGEGLGQGLVIAYFFLFFFLPLLLLYAIILLLEIINLIRNKSFDSTSAIFIYIACSLKFFLYPYRPEWIDSNWALLVLFVRLAVLLLFFLFKVDYFCIKMLICILVAIMGLFNMSFINILFFDAIIACLYIVFNKTLLHKLLYMPETDYKCSASGANNHSEPK